MIYDIGSLNPKLSKEFTARNFQDIIVYKDRGALILEDKFLYDLKYESNTFTYSKINSSFVNHVE